MLGGTIVFKSFKNKNNMNISTTLNVRKILLSFLTLLAISTSVNAQNVNIPDANFKAYLVGNTAINTNSDAEIQVSEATAFSGSINCSNQSISDLTGIEAFTSLTDLTCHTNQLTSIDITNNVNLTTLSCGSNSLTNLNISQNTALTNLNCGFNSLTNLNVSQNTALTTLLCHNNSITSLDISANTNLTSFGCDSNPLTYLNVANGNNTNFTSFFANSVPNLTCVTVDNVAFSTTNWTFIDAQISFSLNCPPAPCTVNIPDANFKAYLVGNTAINTNGNTEIECSEATAFTGQIAANGLSISDMTGIESFINITTLQVQQNNVASLDLTQNTSLVLLFTQNNPYLTSLNVSGCSMLSSIQANYASLSTIDLTNTPSLASLDLGYNANLTSLDLSLNTNLNNLNVTECYLNSLNVANGNNSNFTQFEALDNSLTCITVDDVAYSTANWTNIDSQTSFSLNCGVVLVSSINVQGQAGATTITTQGGTLQMEAIVLPANATDLTYTWSVVNGTGSATISAGGLLTALTDGTVTVTATANDASGTTGTATITISNQSLGVNEVTLQKVNIYPNPVQNQLFIELDDHEVTDITINDYAGRIVKTITKNDTKSINVSDLTKGIYFLKIATKNGVLTNRFIKQ